MCKMSSFNSSLFEGGVLLKAAELAIQTSKNLSFDYFQSDSENESWGIRKTQGTEEERILYKSSEEYTSPIIRVLKIPTESGDASNLIICESQNTLYICNLNILSQ